MTDPAGMSKAQRKKHRRKQRAATDRAGAKQLDGLADTAVDEALAVVARVETEREIGLETEMPSIEAARYSRKLINAALENDEWLTDVEVWVWDAHTSTRDALTPGGTANGIELRLEARIEHG
ncbi:MAG: hypothetical protein AAGC53_23790 [Actinomycetota bacterium]